MTGNGSLFSFIKGEAAAPEPDVRHAPPPPPPAPRQPDLSAKVAELEALVKKLGQEVLRGAAAEKRAAELERSLAELGGKVQKAVAACDGAVKAVTQGLADARGDSARLCSRVDSLESSLAKLKELSAPSGAEPLEAKFEGIRKSLSQALEERASRLEGSVAEFAHKASAAREAASAGLKRLEKAEERLARAAYVETRLAGIEKKFEKFCECEAAVEGLRVGMENLEGTVRDAIHRAAVQAGEQKRTSSEFETLSRQVSQLSALFNHFRVELGFLLPKKQETAGD